MPKTLCTNMECPRALFHRYKVALCTPPSCSSLMNLLVLFSMW